MYPCLQGPAKARNEAAAPSHPGDPRTTSADIAECDQPQYCSAQVSAVRVGFGYEPLIGGCRSDRPILCVGWTGRRPVGVGWPWKLLQRSRVAIDPAPECGCWMAGPISARWDPRFAGAYAR
jgi:hypothetical protein